MADSGRWVVDTSVYTHLCRAGHAEILGGLAPDGVLLVPSPVSTEIDDARLQHRGIPRVGSESWAHLAILTEEETWTELMIKAELGGGEHDNNGECAVIACALHRGLTALIDDRPATATAESRGITVRNTLWLVAEAHQRLHGSDAARTAAVVDDLLATDMWLPISSGAEFVSHMGGT